MINTGQMEVTEVRKGTNSELWKKIAGHETELNQVNTENRMLTVLTGWEVSAHKAEGQDACWVLGLPRLVDY